MWRFQQRLSVTESCFSRIARAFATEAQRYLLIELHGCECSFTCEARTTLSSRLDFGEQPEFCSNGRWQRSSLFDESPLATSVLP